MNGNFGQAPRGALIAGLVCGICLFALGALVIFIGMTMRVTAQYSSTLNIGLLNEQLYLVVLGTGMCLGGVILLAITSLHRSIWYLLQQGSPPPPTVHFPPPGYKEARHAPRRGASGWPGIVDDSEAGG